MEQKQTLTTWMTEIKYFEGRFNYDNKSLIAHEFLP